MLCKLLEEEFFFTSPSFHSLTQSLSLSPSFPLFALTLTHSNTHSSLSWNYEGNKVISSQNKEKEFPSNLSFHFFNFCPVFLQQNVLHSLILHFVLFAQKFKNWKSSNLIHRYFLISGGTSLQFYNIFYCVKFPLQIILFFCNRNSVFICVTNFFFYLKTAVRIVYL